MWHIEFINVFLISSFGGGGGRFSWLLCIARDDEKNELIFDEKLSSIWMKNIKWHLHAYNLNWIKIESNIKKFNYEKAHVNLAFLYAYKGLKKGVS